MLESINSQTVWVVYQEGYYGTEIVAICSTSDRAEEIESTSEGRWKSEIEMDVA